MSESKLGVVTFNRDFKGKVTGGYFSQEGSWGYEYYTKRKEGRVMTYGEFKETFPYRDHNIRSRSLELTKYNQMYNK